MPKDRWEKFGAELKNEADLEEELEEEDSNLEEAEEEHFRRS